MTTIKRTAAAIYALSAMRFVSPFMPDDLRPFKLLADVIGSQDEREQIDLAVALEVIDEMLGRVRTAQVALGNSRDALLASAEHGLMAVREVFVDEPDDQRALMHRDHARDVLHKALAE